MTIKEFNLLYIDLYDGDNLVYSGKSENVPEDLKEKQIEIIKLDNKKLILKLKNN